MIPISHATRRMLREVDAYKKSPEYLRVVLEEIQRKAREEQIRRECLEPKPMAFRNRPWSDNPVIKQFFEVDLLGAETQIIRRLDSVFLRFLDERVNLINYFKMQPPAHPYTRPVDTFSDP